MPDLLKDMFYNSESLHELALRVKAVYPSFQVEEFSKDVMSEEWNELELKARMRKITVSLGKQLPSNYEQALSVLDQVVASYPAGFNDYSLIYFPDFIEVYGQDERHWDLSIAAIERYTPLSTAEFVVRPFIIEHEARMMKQMALWAVHDNEHVRRLASEGCRPALPWAQALSSFKNDPLPVLAILEQLKADPSLYVRKSVANNLNDISKTHPDLIATLAKTWYGKEPTTNWIVKHGCRTLLKKGNKAVLEIFGYHDADQVNVEGFSLMSNALLIGENLTFSFAISAKETTKIRLEYGIDYVKANGKRNRKIFQIAEILLQANQGKQYKKSHSFANMSTRKHYSGVHSIALIVNGCVRETLDFEVS